MHSRSAVLFTALLGLVACATKRSSGPETNEQAIYALGEKFNQYLAAKNDSAIAALYADDAVMLPPNEPRVTGNANIRQFWANLWPLGASLKITPQGVHGSRGGELALEDGDWVFEMPGPKGPQRDNGKYLVFWRKTDGQWKIVRDMWNSDNPLPGAQPAPAP